MKKRTFESKTLSIKYDYLDPDRSEIRLLPNGKNGGMAHCKLPEGEISTLVSHKTVDEIWYVISGEGEMW